MTFPRVRAMIFVVVLFVTAGVVVLTAINRDTQTLPPEAVCQPGQIRVNVEVPQRSDVVINVFNGTGKNGIGEQIAGELENRGFMIGPVATAELFDGVGHITYGPGGVGSAWLVQAYFLDGELDETFVPEREGREVDLMLGDDFQQLATTTEVNQRIAQLGEPELPANSCPGLPLPTLSPTPTPTDSVAPTQTT
jgi:LytR cell envelope-related transcriptional attenuator